MTREEIHRLHEALDNITDAETFIHIGALASHALSGADSYAFTQIFSSTFEHLKAARALLNSLYSGD